MNNSEVLQTPGEMSTHEYWNAVSGLFGRHPKLKQHLRHIYEASIESQESYFDDQIQSNGHDSRAQGRGPNTRRSEARKPGSDGPRRMGVKAGMHELRLLRSLVGDDGEGLREFSKLVIKLVDALPSGLSSK